MSRPTKPCGRCGKNYTPTGQRQQYCRECGPVIRAERLASPKYLEKRRNYQRKYRSKTKEKRNAYERAYYRANLTARREKGRKWFAAHRDERNEYARKYRADFPEKERERKKRYRRSHPEQGRRQSRRRYLKVKAQLAELRSLRAPRRGRGRKSGMLTATKWAITVAATGKLGGATKYAMAKQIYPRQHDINLAYNSVKQLFRKYPKEIELEKTRLGALSALERERELDIAKAGLLAG